MLPFRSGSRFRGMRLCFVIFLAGSCLAGAGDRKRRKSAPTKDADVPKEEFGLKNIPLTVGHAAKGLTLPNYDLQGHILGRFEAATASRIDEDHVRFTDLDMTTYDVKEKVDFKVHMSDAILNLETRVIESKARTTVKRADFEISGDAMSFDTLGRLGKLDGNVRMTIFNQKEILGASSKK